MPDILTVADVMERYGCERHTAAKIMNSLRVFKVGKKLFVRMADLIHWEESRMQYPAVTTNKIPRRRA